MGQVLDRRVDWRWVRRLAPVPVVIAAAPFFRHSDRMHWVAWGLGVAGGALLLIAAEIGERRAGQ